MYSSPMVRTSDVSLSSVLLVMDRPPDVVADDDVREEEIGAMSNKSHLENKYVTLEYYTLVVPCPEEPKGIARFRLIQ